jgi:geranylgeranyl pyrophosphate synthase
MVGEDIAQGKATILSIYALKNLEEADASKLNQYLKSKHEGTEIDLKAAVELITKSGALVFANQRIDTLRD